MSGHIAAIILAAGASTRLGQPKQLIRYQGQSLLARTIAAAGAAGCSPIVAVLGANAERCRPEAAAAEIIMNEEWPTGMASSIRAGLRAVPAADAAILLVCDQPHLNAAHLRALIQIWRDEPAMIACSRYAGTHGVPALFPKADFAPLQALKGDQGARALLRSESARVKSIAWPQGVIDLDRAADLDPLR